MYMPGLLQYLADKKELLAEEDDGSPETAKLWLPLEVELHSRDAVCVEDMVGLEERLREALCFDALHLICHTLRVKSQMVLFKNAQVWGQRESGQSRELIDHVHGWAKDAAGGRMCYVFFTTRM